VLQLFPQAPPGSFPEPSPGDLSTGEVQRRSRLPLLLSIPPSPGTWRQGHIPAQAHISLPCPCSHQALARASPAQSPTHYRCPGPFARALPWLLGRRLPSTSPSITGSLPGRQRCRAAPGAGWPAGRLLLLLSSPQGDPSGGPCLPSHTACWTFFCFSAPSAIKAAALCTSLLAEHGIRHQGRPGGGQLCSEGWQAGRARGGNRKVPVPHLPGRPQGCSLHGLLSPSILLCLCRTLGQKES